MPVHCRIAPSLGQLEGHPNDVWGTCDYTSNTDPTVFMGLYGLPDMYKLWRHKGKKYVFWCGSDIRHFINGYWLDEVGKIRLQPEPLAIWLEQNCENWVENEVEAKALKKVGITAKVCPSFLGDVNQYDISFQPAGHPNVYASVSGDDFKLYGWDKIEDLAAKHPQIVFHLYGNTKPWPTSQANVIVHGRVPKEQMNEEIKHMQGGLRPLAMDGFSEVLAKSILWGQWPISQIPYPHMLTLDQLGELPFKTEPNYLGREYYMRTLNNYPWVEMEITQGPTLERLVAFENDSWPELGASREQLRQRLADFPEGIFILKDQRQDVCQVTVSPKRIGRIGGFKQMRDVPVDRNSPDLWITNIASSVQGKGYATLLLTKVIRWAKDAGYETIQTGLTKIADPNPALVAVQRACAAVGVTLDVIGEVDDYWPEDEASGGWGVIIRITL